MAEESVYRINPDGMPVVVHLEPGQDICSFYKRVLECDNVTYVDSFDITYEQEHTHTLLLFCDQDATEDKHDFNHIVSGVLGESLYGTVLLVCMHAADDNGYERLADVKLIYRAMGRHDEIKKFCSESPETRAFELLQLFKKE